MPPRFTRRRFLKQTALAGAGVWLAAGRAGAHSDSPAEKLHIAIIGAGGRGGENLKAITGQNIVALCDVDDNILARAAAEHPRARQYNDWRKLLDQKDIDAVVISTPDHTHAGPTLAALQLGKHVYCEKPLTHSVEEARLVARAAARAKTATQMGTQIHAGDNYRRVVELIQSGAIGDVRRVHVFVPGFFHGGNRPRETSPVPPHLHWDLWLGPAPSRPYHPTAYHRFKWRGWWDFGGGKLADMACHHMDLSHWALDLRHPQTIEAEGPPDHPESSPEWLTVHFHYPARPGKPPVHLTWYNGDRIPEVFVRIDPPLDPSRAGSLFIGEKGMLVANYGQHRLLPEADFEGFQPPDPWIPSSIGHHNEWIEACKEGTPTTCNFVYAAALTETVLLGNVAYRSGRRIQWDPVAFKLVNAPEAEKYLKREYRKGWELPV